MSFRFSLATLLRLREIAEQREERLLGQIQNQISQHGQMIADLAQQRLDVIQQRENSLTQATSGFDLIDSYARVRALEDLQEKSQQQLAKLLLLRDEQRKIYQAAHRDSQVLSEMRVVQKENFEKALTKKEQSVMDDSFASRRNFR